jgi:hypothetical protein
MKLLPFQKEVLTKGRNYGILALLYRRQAGKSTIFARMGTRWMLEYPGCLVTYASCSLSAGSEMTEKEAKTLTDIVDAMRQAAAASRDVKVTSTADNLPWYDIAELFQKSRFEVSLFHSSTIASRTKIIAANYATARSYSGFVLLDEIGFIRDFKLFYEAVEPIFSSNPDFRLWMATTPPADDTHYSFDLLAPEPGTRFPTNPRGNWYESQAGLPVHRVTADDAAAAGWMFYHPKTREKITPEQHRALAFDRDAWDRNYGLAFPTGGTGAVQLTWLHPAMEKGALYDCRFYENDLPADWLPKFTGGRKTLGVDPATTEGETSNPFSVCVTEHTPGGEYVARVIFRFKSADPAKCKAYLREIVREVKPDAMAIDATNERFWCAEVAEELGATTNVILVVSSEKTVYMGEEMNFKSYLGNLAVNTFEDRCVSLPNAPEIKRDMRLVRRVRGGFNNDVDSAGNHGDTFDGFKLSLHAQTSDTGPVEAHAVDLRPAQANAAHSRDPLPSRPPDDEPDPEQRIYL